MSLKILVNGCSFTALDGMWPEYFPMDYKHKDRNIAVPNASNMSIFHDTIQEIMTNKYDCVIIVWTFLERTYMTTSDNENINVLPNGLVGPLPLITEANEHALQRFQTDYQKHFYSEKIQKRCLAQYQYAIDQCVDAIHLSVYDIECGPTEHPTKKESKKFAKHIMDTYFNPQTNVKNNE